MAGTDPLPFIDEHSRRLEAAEDVVWAALLKVLRRHAGGAGLLAGALACDPREGTAEFGGRPGDAVPGFRVAEVEPGRRLVLQGRHRFARYRLTFIYEGGYLRARTHATFPGFKGSAYRALVIGSGAHRLAARLVLREIASATIPGRRQR